MFYVAFNKRLNIDVSAVYNSVLKCNYFIVKTDLEFFYNNLISVLAFIKTKNRANCSFLLFIGEKYFLYFSLIEFKYS